MTGKKTTNSLHDARIHMSVFFLPYWFWFGCFLLLMFDWSYLQKIQHVFCQKSKCLSHSFPNPTPMHLRKCKKFTITGISIVIKYLINHQKNRHLKLYITFSYYLCFVSVKKLKHLLELCFWCWIFIEQRSSGYCVEEPRPNLRSSYVTT